MQENSEGFSNERTIVMIALYNHWPILFLYTILYTDVVVGGRVAT
jgi:hypothetical protein